MYKPSLQDQSGIAPSVYWKLYVSRVSLDGFDFGGLLIFESSYTGVR